MSDPDRKEDVPETAPGAWRDLTVPLEELVRQAPRWTLGLAAVVFVPYVLLWGLPEVPALEEVPRLLVEAVLHVLLFLLVYAISVFVHEGLHAAGMMAFAGVPPRTIRFRARLREGIAYVHTDRPMSARAYRGVLALPGIVTGVLPAGAGLFYGSGWLAFYGFVMLASALGDLVVLRLMRPLPGDALVRDHPSRVGCQVWVSSRFKVDFLTL